MSSFAFYFSRFPWSLETTTEFSDSLILKLGRQQAAAKKRDWCASVLALTTTGEEEVVNPKLRVFIIHEEATAIQRSKIEGKGK